MVSYLLLLAGVICAAAGGELFVKGAVGLARWAKVSPGVIAVTVAAFATSSPELSVAVNSALDRAPEIALGNALGANVVNVALILGIALLISGMRTQRESVRRDFPAALVIPAITVLFASDGLLSRLEGGLMLAGFAVWLLVAVNDARQERRRAAPSGTPEQHKRALLAVPAGLALLVAAGSLIVDGARGIAVEYGLEEFVIGATVVAIGTTVPELATTLIAKHRGHDDVGLGTVLGSNLFNGLFIVGVAAVIHPIAVAPRDVLVAAGFGLAAVALVFPAKDGSIRRNRGLVLLLLYIAYLGSVLMAD